MYTANIPRPISTKNANEAIKKIAIQEKKEANQLLEKYYNLCFPYKLVSDFVSFCGQELFINRRFTFNYGDQTYANNYHFQDHSQFRIEMLARVPLQLMVGAVMSDRQSVFQPSPVVRTRELIFDIDLTDYACVRNCCTTEKKCCSLCWEYLRIVYRLVDTELRETYNFKHIMWAFSGRRGVHCYVFDNEAREMRNIVDDMMLTKRSIDGTYKLKDVINFRSKFIVRSLTEFKKHLVPLCVVKQNLFATDHGIKMLIESSIHPETRNKLETLLTPLKGKGHSSSEIFKQYEKCLQQLGGQTLNQCRIFLMLRIFSPRFDGNVTSQNNHLLKCPFSLNSSTGNIITPFDVTENFDPIKDAVKITTVLREFNENKDTMKTSLKKPLEVFENFLFTWRADEAQSLKKLP